MKILLTSLPFEKESRGSQDYNAPYSLGLAYLYSALEAKGHELKLLFLNNHDESYAEVAFQNCLEEWRPNLVGFQVFSMNRVSTFSAIEWMAREHSDVKVVLGGVHTSVMYEQILERYCQVVAVIGEGEVTFGELVSALEKGTPLEEVDGLAYVDEGKVRRTQSRALIPDLDSLPFPKHEVFFDNEPNRTIGHIVSTRGCPFDCSFCCLKVISQRIYRKRNIRTVVEEIKYLKHKYPRLKQIQFHDDTFMLDNNRVIEFCKIVLEEKLEVKFLCSARVKPISAEMFSWMERAGFEKIMFGLETGSEKLLDSIHKGICRQDVITLFKTIKPYNLTLTTFLMCGFPGEDNSTVSETIQLVNEMQKIHYNCIVGVAKLMVFPGTEVYRVMKERGKISDDFWLTDMPIPLFTVEHDLETLTGFEERMMDNVSILRIFRWNGFVHHFLKMPFTIIWFLLTTNRKKEMYGGILQANFPKLYRLVSSK